MRVWALWHGGSSYGAPYVSDHLEAFGSITAARGAFVDRHDTGTWLQQTFNYVHQDPCTVYAPGVDDDTEMWLWLYDPSDTPDPYPWKILRYGARGGVRLDRA
jgi:hypothetical protein